MDFNEFVKEYNEKYGLADEEWDNLKKSVVLSFTEDEPGKVMSWYRGVPVFRHKSSELSILTDETWICSLDTSKVSYYFATGLQRVDSSFFYGLKQPQIVEIADVIWNEQRMIFEPLLEEKYKEIMNNQISAAVENERKEYVGQIEDLKEQKHQLEQKDAENKQIIASLTEKVNKTLMNRSENELTKLRGINLGISDLVTEISVFRDGPDTISSPMFDKPRYFVHLSADHRILVVRPHESGNVVCIDNDIVLLGLGLVSQYDGPYEMVAEYNAKYGGIQIYL
jgi:hypothetical protein